MNDQNNAPELPARIWAWSEDDDFLRAKPHGVMHGTEYIRADRAAPTDNTALVEEQRMKEHYRNCWKAQLERANGLEAALASREPPPACQQEAVTESDLAAARAEIERLTKERDLSKELLRSCIQGNNVLRKKAQKAIAERDEARSMLADAERDMRQRAAEICRSVAPPKTYHRGDHTGSMQVIAQKCAAAILALPLKYMGQIHAECDCPHPERCTSHCIAERNK